MYWNNPIIEYRWPSNEDPVAKSLHNGNHCLFYDPEFDKNQIHYNQKLENLCHWANDGIRVGVSSFLANPQNHYDIANLVKLNMWINDIRQQGIVKPMLIAYTDQYLSSTGESRLRALERIPAIKTVTAFISTSVEHCEKFQHLQAVTTFDQFAKLCGAVEGQVFLFRLTDEQAPYGIDWYEYNSSRTAPVTPGQDYCVEAVTNYLKQHPDTVFTPEWFDQSIIWDQYKNS